MSGNCYIDIASAKKKSSRVHFERMLDDCKSKKLDIVITKSVSRFGHDTVDTLKALKLINEYGIRLIFEQENLDTNDTDSYLMISIIESLAQAENESRSDNIKWESVKGRQVAYRSCITENVTAMTMLKMANSSSTMNKPP